MNAGALRSGRRLPPDRPRLSAALFDLDGTLLDTAPDIAHAMNRLLGEHARAPLEFPPVRAQVSNGATAVVRIGFPDVSGANFEVLRLRLLDLYAARLAAETRLFDGFENTLGSLEAAGIPWGIVTNKPGWLTDPLLAQLQLDRRAGCVLSGDSLDVCKPHPRPLRVAAGLLNVPPEQCVYVGDARRDISAARAAGMLALGAGFGYFGADEDLAQWQADGWIAAPGELLDWFDLSA